MEKPIKSITFSDPEDLKVGDRVFIGDMPQENMSGCMFCHNPKDKTLGILQIFDDKNVCEKHQKDLKEINNLA